MPSQTQSSNPYADVAKSMENGAASIANSNARQKFDREADSILAALSDTGAFYWLCDVSHLAVQYKRAAVRAAVIGFRIGMRFTSIKATKQATGPMSDRLMEAADAIEEAKHLMADLRANGSVEAERLSHSIQRMEAVANNSRIVAAEWNS